MTRTATERLRGETRRFLKLLTAPSQARLEYAIRMSIIVALVVLVLQTYELPLMSLSAYVVFFMIRPDRTTTVLLTIILTLLITIIIAALVGLSRIVLDYPALRIGAMMATSLILLFLASASKLKPIAPIIVLIVAYALDVLGEAQIGELATRALLYTWLIIAIPAGMSICVSLLIGPSPRRLLQNALAERVQAVADLLRYEDARSRAAFKACVEEGFGEMQSWLKLMALEKTSPQQDVPALKRSLQSVSALLLFAGMIERGDAHVPIGQTRQRLAGMLDDTAGIFEKGFYPTDIDADWLRSEVADDPISAAVRDNLANTLAYFSDPEPVAPDAEAVIAASAPAEAHSGFLSPDAFTNPAHSAYALKTTLAAMICYLIYSGLNWPGIHTCMITCYIVSLGSAAESVEKLTLRIIGCLLGGAAAIGTIVFVLPHLTSITALVGVSVVGTMIGAWVAGGGPRIGYAGFQFAFAFYMGLLQGPAPEFNMTDVRDRMIGILLGNVVIFLVQILIEPVSLSRQVDPAIAKLLKGLSGIAKAGRRAQALPLVAPEMTARAGLEVNLNLVRYEPESIRPDEYWLAKRRLSVNEIAKLEAPLLLLASEADKRAEIYGARLEELAQMVEQDPSRWEDETRAVAREENDGRGLAALIERRLARLEYLMGASGKLKGAADHAAT